MEIPNNTALDAILAWLNSLDINEKKIMSISELKDGLIFANLLNKVYF